MFKQDLIAKVCFYKSRKLLCHFVFPLCFEINHTSKITGGSKDLYKTIWSVFVETT